jgi:cyclophilin family peptidyl-prolyl cis-trans isomerase
MMRSLALLAVLAACPGKAVDHPKPVDDTALRIKIAGLEAARGDGLDPLIELANNGDQPTRLLALRGLGRVGGNKALATLSAALGDPDVAILDTAAQAIGIATSLDEETAGQLAITKALLDARAKHPEDAAIVEAIGRAAESSAQRILAAGLTGSAAIAEASAVALGRFGRRKIAWLAPTQTAMIAATKHVDARVRLAAAYALAREHLVKAEGPSRYLDDSGTALELLLKDGDALIRAQAAQALVRRKLVVPHQIALARAAHDPDWRVAVEAIRGLAGESSDARGRWMAACLAMYWLWSVDGGGESWSKRLVLDVQQMADSEAKRVALSTLQVTISKLGPVEWAAVPGAPGAHVVNEALRALASKLDDPSLVAILSAIGARAAASTTLPVVTRAWIECLALVGATRHAPAPSLAAMSGCRLPDHLRYPLVGELIAAKVDTLEARRAALQPMLAHQDPRVRVAGMTALASMWSDGAAADHEAVVAMAIAALADKDGLVAGTALETTETLYEQIDKASATPLRDRLDAALLARAQTEQDPELATSLFGVIAKRKLAAGAPACRRGVRGAPVLAKAAVECLKALGETIGDEPLPIAAAKAPPVELAAVINKQVRWTLATTRGEIVIELRPDVAPWAVATIVALTRKGYYDRLEVHRVVPNFVAQGGDPTQSGWGGPGFAIPAEPSTGAGYVEGGVGMADAGRDSAGSQWFVMHGPAPHLDGRYTWVGRVVSGQSAANSLLIGDQVETATVALQDRP